MKKQAVIYTIKVWLTAAIVAPILITALHFYFLSINGLHPFKDPKILHIEFVKLARMIGVDIVFYSILGLIFYFITLSQIKKQLRFQRIKIHLTLCGVLLIIVPLTLMYWCIWYEETTMLYDRYLISQFLHNMICELIALIPGIWIYGSSFGEQLSPKLNEISEIH